MSDRFTQVIGSYGPRIEREFGLTPEQAAGLLGNIAWESGQFRFYQEVGSGPNSGGRGWAQWSGARRVSFLAYCKVHGFAPTSDEASYNYLCMELHGTYRSVIAALKRCGSVDSATTTFERRYEAAGKPALSGRIGLARKALSILHPGHPAAAEPARKARKPRAAGLAKKARAPRRAARHAHHHHG